LTLSSNEQNLQELSTSQLPSLSLDNLKPWRKYVLNGEVRGNYLLNVFVNYERFPCLQNTKINPGLPFSSQADGRGIFSGFFWAKY